MRPLVLAESAAAAGAAVAALRRDGWTPVDVGALPAEPWDLSGLQLLVAGSIGSADERAAVLVAAARGAGVVALTPRDRAELATFFDELARLGHVELARDGRAAALTHEQRRILELLAAGDTVREAADRLSLSRRTAHRRLAEARAVLGVGTTAEAMLVFRAGEETRRGPGLRRV